MGDSLSIFLCFQALAEYQKLHKSLPPNWSVKESKVFVDLVEQAVKKLEKSEE
jgi:molybdopterin/thiamine biosynthesis adenylyltransferase